MKKNNSIKAHFIRKFKGLVWFQTLTICLILCLIGIFEDTILITSIENFINKYLYGYLLPKTSKDFSIIFKISWYFSIVFYLINAIHLLIYLLKIDYDELFNLSFENKTLEMGYFGCFFGSFVLLFGTLGGYFLILNVYTTIDNTGLTLYQSAGNFFYKNTTNSILFLLFWNHTVLYVLLISLVGLYVLKHRLTNR